MADRRSGATGFRGAALCLLALLVLPDGISAGRYALADPPQAIYVSSEDTDTVAAVEAGTLQLLQDIEVGDRPHNLEVTGDNLVVVATQGAETVSVIDPLTNPASVRRIALGARPHDLALSGDGRTVYVVSADGFLARLDPASARLDRRVTLGGRPHNVVASGGSAWITDISSRQLHVVDEGSEVRDVPLSIVGHDLAQRPATGELWVTPWNDTRVVIVNTETRREIAELPAGRSPSHKHVAFTEDGGEAWITEPSSGRLFIVDARTRGQVEEIELGGPPHHVRLAAGRAYVAVGPQDLVVLDVESRSVVGRAAVGSGVHDAALGHRTE